MNEIRDEALLEQPEVKLSYVFKAEEGSLHIRIKEMKSGKGKSFACVIQSRTGL